MICYLAHVDIGDGNKFSTCRHCDEIMQICATYDKDGKITSYQTKMENLWNERRSSAIGQKQARSLPSSRVNTVVGENNVVAEVARRLRMVKSEADVSSCLRESNLNVTDIGGL